MLKKLKKRIVFARRRFVESYSLTPCEVPEVLTNMAFDKEYNNRHSEFEPRIHVSMKRFSKENVTETLLKSTTGS